jgi:cbb3-type cytochrome oxidase subunit 3
MTGVVIALFYLAIGVHVYRDAKRNGQWSWARFFFILAATGVFLAALIVPLAHWQGGQAHPGILITIMLSAIVVFVAALIFVLRKTAKKTAPVATTADRIS